MKKELFSSIGKILQSLDKRQKSQLYFLIVLILISVMLEAFGIGLVIPIVSLILDPKSILQNEFIAGIFNDKLNNTNLIYVFFCAVGLFFIFKNIFLISLNWIQSKKLNKISLELSQKLYRVYLNSSYEFHTQVNKSILFNNVHQIRTFVTGLESLMLLIGEFFILIGILFILLYYEFFGTIIIIAVFALSSSIIFLLTYKPLAKWGKFRFQYAGKKFKMLNEVFTGIKELKILNRNQYFFNEFTQNEKSDLELDKKVKVINLVPRLSFEIIFILCIFSFLFYKFQSGFNVSSVIPILALYAAAFFRIFPSIFPLGPRVKSIFFLSPGFKLVKVL